MTFEEVFLNYSIHPKFWSGLQAHVMAGAEPIAELQVRLDYVKNYRDCLSALMAGARPQPKLTPAIIPFESIEVQDEPPDRLSRL